MLLLVKVQDLSDNDRYNIYLYILILIFATIGVAIAEMFFDLNIYDIYGSADYSEQYNWAMSSGLSWRAKSTFVNPLVYGSTMVMCLPVIDFLRKRSNKVLFILGSIVILVIADHGNKDVFEKYYEIRYIRNKKDLYTQIIKEIPKCIILYGHKIEMLTYGIHRVLKQNKIKCDVLLDVQAYGQKRKQ